MYSDGTHSYSDTKPVVFVERFEFKLASFDLQKINLTTAEVKFVVSAERFGLKYDIERSLNGTNYDVIGQVQAVGSSTNSTTYSFLDTNPFKDKAYYRIKYSNTKGQSQHSYAQIIDFGNLVSYGVQNLTIFPNPTTDFVEVNMPPVPIKLTVFNLSGQVLKQAKFAVGEKIRVGISELTPGMYILEVQNSTTQKILGTGKFYKN